MILAHDVVGDPAAGTTVVFLHGILGSRNNWKSFAKKLVEARPHLKAVVADLRNHGDSHGAPPPHTLAACADDVAELVHVAGGDVVVGHSFGGKVALVYAERSPASLAQAWALDAPPGPRVLDALDALDAVDALDDRAHSPRSDVERVIDAVRGVAMPVASRRALVEVLRARGLAEPLCQWMTTNLREEAGAFVWRFDLDAIPEMLRSFGAIDLWPFIEGHRDRPQVHLLRAARGQRFTDDDTARLARAAGASGGAVVAHVLEDAGHWLHTDNPAGLLAILTAHLP